MSTAKTSKSRPIVWYDSDCVVCSRSMHFIMTHETDDQLIFGTLKSPEGRAAREQASSDPSLDSIVFQAADGHYHHSSDALLEISKFLKAPWRWAQIFKILPRSSRDTLYRWFARNRHKFGPKKRACPIPTEAMRKRML